MLVWAIGLSLGGTTRYAINPARDLGPWIVHAILPIPQKRPTTGAMLPSPSSAPWSAEPWPACSTESSGARAPHGWGGPLGGPPGPRGSPPDRFLPTRSAVVRRGPSGAHPLKAQILHTPPDQYLDQGSYANELRIHPVSPCLAELFDQKCPPIQVGELGVDGRHRHIVGIGAHAPPAHREAGFCLLVYGQDVGLDQILKLLHLAGSDAISRGYDHLGRRAFEHVAEVHKTRVCVAGCTVGALPELFVQPGGGRLSQSFGHRVIACPHRAAASGVRFGANDRASWLVLCAGASGRRGPCTGQGGRGAGCRRAPRAGNPFALVLRSARPRRRSLARLPGRRDASPTAFQAVRAVSPPRPTAIGKTSSPAQPVMPRTSNITGAGITRTADAEGCDFPGSAHTTFAAPPSTWRQEVGGSSPESALGVGPRLPQHEPGDLDTRDSGGENEPTLWPRQSWSFSRRRSRSFRDRDITRSEEHTSELQSRQYL